MKKWLILLIGLTLTLVVAGTVMGFTLSGVDSTAEQDTAGQVDDSSGDQTTVRSDDGIDPNECNWVHNINACFTDNELPTEIPMDEYMGGLTLSMFDLNERLGLENIGSLKLSKLEQVTWSNSCLGYHQPDTTCADVMVPGFRTELESDGRFYTYHTSSALSDVFSNFVVYVGLTEGKKPNGGADSLPPIRSDEGIDPKECNQVHNINACDDGELGGDPEPEPGICGVTSYPTPDLDSTDRFQGQDTPTGAHQGVAITPDGNVAIVDVVDLEPADDEGKLIVHPSPPPDDVQADSEDAVVEPPPAVTPLVEE